MDCQAVVVVVVVAAVESEDLGSSLTLKRWHPSKRKRIQ